MSRALPLVFFLLFAHVAPSVAVDVEIFGGIGAVFSQLDTVYDASYTPSRVVGIRQLFEEPDSRSHARQMLALQARPGPGFGLGVNIYPTSVFGIQVLVDHVTLDIGGANPPHEVSLTYDTIAFPFPDPVVRTTAYSFDPPDTEGRLDTLSSCFNLAARIGAGRRVSGSLSGGLTVFRLEVEAERLGALAGWFGGHAVVFTELHEASYRAQPASAIGFNLGGQLDVSLGSGLAVVVDVRWLAAPKTEAVVELDQLLSNNVNTVSLAQIESFLDLPPLEIDPSYVRFLFGLKWKP